MLDPSQIYPLTIFIRKFISSRLTWFLYRKRKLLETKVEDGKLNRYDILL